MDSAKTVMVSSIASGESESSILSMEDYIPTAGMVRVPSVWTAADIAFKVCDTKDGTYDFLRDNTTGDLVRIKGIKTSSASWYRIPEDVMGAYWVKLVSVNTASEAAVNQAAARSLKLLIKG